MLVKECKIILNRADMSTFTHVPFCLEEDHKRLRITCKYAPKYLEDAALNAVLVVQAFKRYAPYLLHTADTTIKLSNHFSYSLDTPAGHSGTAHRHSPFQVFDFCADSASPGFCPFEIVKGGYVVTVAANSIVADGTEVDITVEAFDD